MKNAFNNILTPTSPLLSHFIVFNTGVGVVHASAESALAYFWDYNSYFRASDHQAKYGTKNRTTDSLPNKFWGSDHFSLITDISFV